MSAYWGRERVGNSAEKVSKRREKALLSLNILFSVVSGIEKRAFKSHFVIIFLY